METEMQSLLEIDNISCDYAGQQVVRQLSLSLREGELACLLGSSGCGKTTVLRAIAGLHDIAGGSIRFSGQAVAGTGFQLPAEQRGIGMVFQDYALFPHLTVAGNITFGLHGMNRQQKKQQAERWLKVIRLEGLGGRYPHELSGGQQQRVALARALAPRPRLLLLDEPFSNLDVEMREQLAVDIRNILRAEGTTALFVTHDQDEAFVLGDKIGVMHEGSILQWDTPFNLYHKPASRFVAGFIGQGVLLDGYMVSDKSVSTPLGIIKGQHAYPWRDNTAVEVLLRPDDVVISADGLVSCKVIERAFRGAETLYTLQLESGEKVLSLMPSHDDFSVGQKVAVDIHAPHLVAFLRQQAASTQAKY